jgi:predicted dehydrogenase
MADDISRRKFVTDVGLTTAGFVIVPRHVLGKGQTPPSDKLNVACVGAGGQGRTNMVNMASQNIVALADVDWDYAGVALDRLETDALNIQKRLDATPEKPILDSNDKPLAMLTPLERTRQAAQRDGMRVLQGQLRRVTRYQDYREMFEKEKSIDGVIVATPDHMHAQIALAAMDLGKHVYVQKPLTWSIAEARQLSKRARETKVATQMGNQGHSWDDARTAVEYVWAGAIGEVREIHIWTNRPLGYWPQGVPRPEALKPRTDALKWNGPGVTARVANALAGYYPIPSTLRWDLFIGPSAPHVDYHPIYHPFNWRGWVDWGVGAIGDMGAHLIDHSMWALDLGYPTTVETVSTPFNGVCFPHATMTFYEFPARGNMPAVKLTWYDGGLLPPKPVELDGELNKGGGALLVGSKGKLLHDTYGAKPRLLPAKLHESYGPPARKLPRIPDENHEMNWVDAAKGKTAASCPFEYASKLTEVMLLGIVALRAGKKITYDSAKMRVTNDDRANEYLARAVRTD